MRVAIILPSVHWNCPYADIYARLFDKYGIQYDMISFNRKLDQEDTKHHFDYGLSNSSSSIKKLIALLKYCSFVSRILKKEQYDRLVVFSSQVGLGLLPTLLLHYKKRYIFDYRDLSIEQYLKYPFRYLLKNSYINVVSSPGFIRVLPKEFVYYICHNVNVETAERSVNTVISGDWPKGTKHILTIGGIRDYEANKEVIDSIAGRSDYSLSFVGRGESSQQLANYCNSINASNVSFSGFYEKEQEKDFVLSADFINIFYPRKLSHDTAISNRFYNSLIYKKPMITTANTIQGDLAAEYRVGVALNNCNELVSELNSFIKSNDYSQYCVRCNTLLLKIIKEQHSFENRLLSFVK